MWKLFLSLAAAAGTVVAVAVAACFVNEADGALVKPVAAAAGLRKQLPH